MKTELGYDVSGPDSGGDLEIRGPAQRWMGDEMYVYFTHADLVAMLALYDEVEEQADDQEDAA